MTRPVQLRRHLGRIGLGGHGLTCYKCDGHLCQDKMHDLPRAYREFYCVNCGQRFWIDARTLTVEVGPIGSGFLTAAARN